MFKFDENNNKKLLMDELFSFLYSSFTIDDWICELSNADSAIYEFIKEDVEILFYNVGGYLKNLDFESLYHLSVIITINQIQKNIKMQKEFFFTKRGFDYSCVCYIIKQRLTNNLKNLFDPKRNTNILTIENWIINNIYKNDELNFTIRDLTKLANSNPQIIIDNLLELSKKFEITTYEIEELGEKINMDFSELITININNQFKHVMKDANNQSYFLLEGVA